MGKCSVLWLILSPVADLKCVHLLSVNFTFQELILKSEIFYHSRDSGQTGADAFRDTVGGITGARGRSKIYGHSQVCAYRILREQHVTHFPT